MRQPPTGTVTFLFTDIEGSTRLWEKHGDAMRPALARHDDLLRGSINAHRGVLVKTTGDGIHAAFATAPDALAAALSAQNALRQEAWSLPEPLLVRMGLHTGSAEERGGDYFGPPLNRAARLMAAGAGGQILLSRATQELCRDTLPPNAALRDLGEHRLKDLGRPEHVFQLLHPKLPDNFPPLRSLDNAALPNNLPLQATSFIGREAELAEIKARLAKTRLLTLTGAGGSGKTRLSLQAAADLLDGTGDGVWLVELAPLADPALVPLAVAEALGVKEQAGQSLPKTLTAWLKPKRLLLLLDNCEHLVAACASLASDLLRACPSLHILASSREPLNVPGEQVYRVPSLSLPDPEHPPTVEALSHYEAVRLFIERAQAVQPAFAVSDANAPAVAQVCWRLDGIPLALELAAARLRVLSVEEINARLHDRFRLLTGGSRTLLPRQQTLRALIDWSYGLLTDQEKVMLCRLSVFAGGWTLAAAEEVCADADIEPWAILDLLMGLTDKSLVSAEPFGGQTHYGLLETVRQYAGEHLAASGQTEAVRRRHQDFFLTLAEEARPHLTGREQAQRLRVLEAEHDNLRQALAFAAEETSTASEAVQKGLRLTAALQPFWEMRGHLGEGQVRMAGLLAHPGAQAATPARAAALCSAGVMTRLQGGYAAALPLLTESLELFRAQKNRRGVANCLHEMATVFAVRFEVDAALSHAEESVALWREIGDKQGIAEALTALGWAAGRQDDFEWAGACHGESLALRREIGDQGGTALGCHNLGDVICWQGDYAAAQSLYEESRTLWHGLGDTRRVAIALDSLGSLASAQGDGTAAEARYTEALAIHRKLSSPINTAHTLAALGNLACLRGDFSQARFLHEECLTLHRQNDNPRGIGYCFLDLGFVALSTGDFEAARVWYTESLTVFQTIPGQNSALAALEGFAVLAMREGQAVRGARLWGAADAGRARLHAPLPPQDQRQYAPFLAAARQALGDAGFEAAWAAGGAMTLEAAAEDALSPGAEGAEP